MDNRSFLYNKKLYKNKEHRHVHYVLRVFASEAALHIIQQSQAFFCVKKTAQRRLYFPACSGYIPVLNLVVIVFSFLFEKPKDKIRFYKTKPDKTQHHDAAGKNPLAKNRNSFIAEAKPDQTNQTNPKDRSRISVQQFFSNLMADNKLIN
jgi:hypothetical protein